MCSNTGVGSLCVYACVKMRVDEIYQINNAKNVLTMCLFYISKKTALKVKETENPLIKKASHPHTRARARACRIFGYWECIKGKINGY